jgi:hypothetical protein
MSDGPLPNHGSTTVAALIWPISVAIVAVVVTARWLQTTEVA